MSGTASIGRRVKFQAPKPAMARTPIITSQRWRIAKERIPSIIVSCASLRQFRFHDETVLRSVNVALQHAECNFHKIRIAFADLDIAGFELFAVADENDGAVF